MGFNFLLARTAEKWYDGLVFWMENSPVEWRNAVWRSTERQEKSEEIEVIALTAGDLGIVVQVDEMVRIPTSSSDPRFARSR